MDIKQYRNTHAEEAEVVFIFETAAPNKKATMTDVIKNTDQSNLQFSYTEQRVFHDAFVFT